MNPIDQAIKDLQDALLVTSEIEKRHSASLKDHQQAIDDLYKVYSAHNRLITALSEAALSQIETTISTNKTISRLNAEAAEFERRTKENLAEITDKLNGLIGYVGGLQPPKHERPAH